jgi:hypothetical protein
VKLVSWGPATHHDDMVSCTTGSSFYLCNYTRKYDV